MSNAWQCPSGNRRSAFVGNAIYPQIRKNYHIREFLVGVFPPASDHPRLPGSIGTADELPDLQPSVPSPSPARRRFFGDPDFSGLLDPSRDSRRDSDGFFRQPRASHFSEQ